MMRQTKLSMVWDNGSVEESYIQPLGSEFTIKNSTPEPPVQSFAAVLFKRN
jgi:hypothetical protein